MLVSHKDLIKTTQHMMRVKRMATLSHMIKIKLHLLVKFGLMMQPSQTSLKMVPKLSGNLN